MKTNYECFSQVERVLDEKNDILSFLGVQPGLLQLECHFIWPNFPSNWVNNAQSSFKCTI